MLTLAPHLTLLSNRRRSRRRKEEEDRIDIMAIPFQSAREILAGIDETAEVVLLGECTHGTEEFYKIRAEVSEKSLHIHLCTFAI